MGKTRNIIKVRLYHGFLIVMAIGIPVLLLLGSQLDGNGTFFDTVFALATFVLLALYVVHTNRLGRRN